MYSTRMLKLQPNNDLMSFTLPRLDPGPGTLVEVGLPLEPLEPLELHTRGVGPVLGGPTHTP